MTEEIIAFVNSDTKVDFESFFDANYRAQEYLRTSLLEKMKQSREFFQDKNLEFKTVNTNTGQQEVYFDYNTFLKLGIDTKLNPKWKPKKMTGVSRYTFKFGDMLYKLFKNYVNMSTGLTLCEFDKRVDANKEKISKLQIKLAVANDDKDKDFLQSQIDQTTESVKKTQEMIAKAKKEVCIEQILSDLLLALMNAKIHKEEDKALAEESQNLLKEEQKASKK